MFGRRRSDDDYPKALASWQIEHGLGSSDMTAEQEARSIALKAAHGDTDAAEKLADCRWLARHGGWRDDR